jgi:hypothetical protein
MWTTIILFVCILFLYIHIQHQFKSGSDLEIYEYDYTTHQDFQSIVNYKQPILFPLIDLTPTPSTSPTYLKVKDVRDYRAKQNENTYVDPIILPKDNAHSLLQTDKKSIFYSNDNHSEIIQSTEWAVWFEQLDTLLKPQFTISTNYDLLYGSTGTQTTTYYLQQSHNFLYLPPTEHNTSVRIKMTPWKSKSYLSTVEDPVYYEFWSKENLFHPSSKELQSLDFQLEPGHILCIPPYWFYSIQFTEENQEIVKVSYTTVANAMAHSKSILQYYLQQQNIQEKWLKPFTNDSQKTPKVKDESTEESIEESTKQPKTKIDNVELDSNKKVDDQKPTPSNEQLADSLLKELTPSVQS